MIYRNMVLVGLSGHKLGFFRATLYSNISSFMETVVKLCKNSDLHVAGEVEICFQINTLKGVNFIVNITKVY